jgi:hypothetical protein
MDEKISRVRIDDLRDLLAWMGNLNTQDFQWQLKKLNAMRSWAMEKAGIDFEVGDAVVIAPGFVVRSRNADNSPNGWWGYRECLNEGATGVAHDIDFSPHINTWVVDFKLDREWSISEFAGDTSRYWHGMVGDTPPGYRPPSSYDQEHYPEGRRHIFSMRASDLRKVQGGGAR